MLFLIMVALIISEIGFIIPKFENLKEYMAFGIPSVPGNLATWIVNSSDLYVIGILLGTAFVGIYSPGYYLGSIITVFSAPLLIILPSVLSKYYDDNNFTEVRVILSYSLKYFLAIAIPSTFGISILSKPLLTILSTPEIASKGNMITPLIAISSLFFGVFIIIQQVIILEKKMKIIGQIWIISAILNLVLNFVLVPFVGIMGAAISTLLSFTLNLIFISYYTSKSIKLNIDVKFILKSIFSSIIMCFMIIEFNPIGIFNLMISIGICAMFYIIILLKLSGFDKGEIHFFKNMIKS
jgi:O-antigen/teichoic acid export membrane protein